MTGAIWGGPRLRGWIRRIIGVEVSQHILVVSLDSQSFRVGGANADRVVQNN